MNQDCVSAANVLSGERMVKEISFPLTGDLELDCCSGLIAVLAHFENHARAEKLLACLAFVRRRYEAMAEQQRINHLEEERLVKIREAMQGRFGQVDSGPAYPTLGYTPVDPSQFSQPGQLAPATVAVQQSLTTSAKVDSLLHKSLLSP